MKSRNFIYSAGLWYAPKRPGGPVLSPEKLVRRARERGHHRQPGVGGFCRECYLAELEEAIAEGHPELDRGEVFELVQEWLAAEDEPVQ